MNELKRFSASYEFELDDFQLQACAAVEEGRGVLVAAPTGAGKTVVGEFAVSLALATGRKAFYTTPIKALSNQKFLDLTRRHGSDNVGLLTGDTSINPTAPVVVMTTEVLRNMLYGGSSALNGLGFVVMDEVHYLADRFRGPVWEEVIIHLPDDVQIVSLSATVSNAEEFGDWLSMVRGDTAVVVSEHRPVPLWQHVMVGEEVLDLYRSAEAAEDAGRGAGVSALNPELVDALRNVSRAGRLDSGGRGGARGGARGRGRSRGGVGGGHRKRPQSGGGSSSAVPSRVQVIETLDEMGLLPAIYFVFSRAGCDGAVAQCAAAGLTLTTAAQRAEIRHIVEARTADLPGEDLDVLGYWGWLDSLERGIAAHHAGMLPVFKETVEELFTAGLVRVVFATETLALGINMPARSVVLEKLVKWDGQAHQEITAGEFTQLTGRAGRRGIDVDGHAIVVYQPGLDPVALGGLASRRTYPLNSRFKPTYNMSINLVAQVGRERAREILEMSFAQFQADRGVVGLAKEAQAHAEALDGYAAAMHCELGDFAEYSLLRRRIKERESELSHHAAQKNRHDIEDSLRSVRMGDVLEIPGGRRAGFAIVLDAGAVGGFEGPRPTVLGEDQQVRRLSLADISRPVRTVGSLRIPKNFTGRTASARRELAGMLRDLLRAQGLSGPSRAGKIRSGAHDDERLVALRAELRAHPCHDCPDRENHARWAERHVKLRREYDGLLRRIKGRTGSIAKVFDQVCSVLAELGYLGPHDEITADGERLRRLYAERDLVFAECLRDGAWVGLDAPGLAAVVSALVYESRRDDRSDNNSVPPGHNGSLADGVAHTERLWSRLEDVEIAHRLEPTAELDTALVAAMYHWASGRSLRSVLKEHDLAAGDFVRWSKQVLDLLDQLVKAAPSPRMRGLALEAVDKVRRGVVAYSSV